MKTTIKVNRLLALGLTSLTYLASSIAFAEEPAKAETAEQADHEGNGHNEKKAGPNGGLILTEVEPHAELFVTAERKIQITFLNDEGEKVAPEKQSVSAITGQRSAPTRMKFELKEGVLISDQALPEGMNVPAIFQVRMTPEAKTQTIRLNLNLEDCPTCEHLEYACTCDHEAEGEGEDGHKGHDH